MHLWFILSSIFIFQPKISNGHHLLQFYLSESCKSLDNSQLYGFYHKSTWTHGFLWYCSLIKQNVPLFHITLFLETPCTYLGKVKKSQRALLSAKGVLTRFSYRGADLPPPTLNRVKQVSTSKVAKTKEAISSLIHCKSIYYN